MSEPYKFKTQFDFEVFATDDLENDLRGQTRALSACSSNKYHPQKPKDTSNAAIRMVQYWIQSILAFVHLYFRILYFAVEFFDVHCLCASFDSLFLTVMTFLTRNIAVNLGI